jgi:hypothetical protein
MTSPFGATDPFAPTIGGEACTEADRPAAAEPEAVWSATFGPSGAGRARLATDGHPSSRS